MNTTKNTVLGATLLFVIAVNTQAEGLYKCMVNGKPVYQQSSCATNDGKRLDIDMDSIRKQEAQAAEIGQARAEARRVEQDRVMSEQAAEREQQMQEPVTVRASSPASLSYEDQNKVDNINSEMERISSSRFSETRSKREQQLRVKRDELRQIYSKYGMNPVAPEPPPPLEQSRHQKPNTGLTNPITGEHYTPSGPGYVGTRDGTYYAPAGPNGVINTKTGQFIPTH